jgi:hypothetical protein
MVQVHVLQVEYVYLSFYKIREAIIASVVTADFCKYLKESK